MKLFGKVALVTGASRGIGAAIAKRFGQEGATVAVHGNRNLNRAKQIVDDIVAMGQAAQAFQADIATVAACERLIEAVLVAFGRIDVLVNSAGTFGPYTIDEVSEEVWDQHQNINLKAPFFLSRAAARNMRANGGGRIINVTSIAAFNGFPTASAYCASKGGLLNLTRAMCLELAASGINVNSIAPGNTRTDINEVLRQDKDFVAHLEANTPSGESYMDPEDLAGAAVFLAGADSRAVHGANVVIDGGFSVQ